MTLEQAKPGIRYCIDAVDCREAAIQRLMVLGLVEGTEVELKSSALGGDPLEFVLFGNAISLRRDQAQRFAVRVSDALTAPSAD